MTARAADGAAWPVAYARFHPRAVSGAAADALPHGFALVVSLPEGAEATLLLEGARGDTASVSLREGAAEAARILGSDWDLAFALLQDAAQPALAGLLQLGGRRHGALAELMPRLPLLRGRAKNLAGYEEALLLLSRAGEVLLVLRGGLEATRPEAAALTTHDARPVPVEGWQVMPLAGGVAAYGRLGALPAQPVELILRCSAAGHWLRAEPQPVHAGAFLKAASVALAAADRGEALDPLARLLAWREVAFAPLLAPRPSALSGALPGAGAARLGILLGAQEPGALRLLHVGAAAIEARFDRLLVAGAEPAAQLFRRRGRLAVTSLPAMDAALREAAAAGGGVVLPALAMAEAMIAGEGPETLPRPMAPAELLRLAELQAAAGRGAGPDPSPAAGDAAAQLVADHLERLWMAGSVPEAAHA